LSFLMQLLFENLGLGFQLLAGWQLLLLIAVGIMIGIVVGALPGLSPSMGVALLVSFTYGMEPMPALVFLVAIYTGASYGGSITAITINAPGTASAVVTAFDGYPMARQGRAGEALGISVVASAIAGLIGTIALVFFAAPLATMAVRFHPAEYFALSVFGLATVASMAGEHWAKALIAVVLGLLLSTVGTDPISGAARFTYGLTELSDGFPLVPALIGLFAISEVLTAVAGRDFENPESVGMRNKGPGFTTYWKLKFTMLRASVLGTIVGIFPGAGATIASFIAYDFEKRLDSHPETYGKGNPRGVAAAEAANSASVGGALVPLLTLGIPGSATTAVLIGAMMIHKLTPGPQLFLRKPEIIYGLFASLFVGNLLLLILGLLGNRCWMRITEIPKRPLCVLILVMSMLGAYAGRNSLFDVARALGFGVIGWVIKRLGYPVAPVILGLVLGAIAETNLRRAIMIDSGLIFFIRPVSAILLLLAAGSFALPFLTSRKSQINTIRDGEKQP
jgi:putative tricarboxylic transport membrane protein